MDYQEFLNTKHSKVVNYGHEIPRSDIHSKLFEWQKDIVAWAVKNLKEAETTKLGMMLFDYPVAKEVL